MYIKLICMIADKLDSNVSLFILTSYIMVFLHNFLYIWKIFLSQELDLFTIINYISLVYSIWMKWKADVLLCVASARNQYWFIFRSFRSVIFALFVFILGTHFLKSFHLFGLNSTSYESYRKHWGINWCGIAARSLQSYAIHII